MRPQKLIEIAAVIAVAVLVGIVAFRQAAEHRGEELRMAVATMPLGITGAEADAIVVIRRLPPTGQLSHLRCELGNAAP